jgi:hypothetical protein
MTDHRDVAGLEYLDAVTRVLQRRRLAQPERETWEAAEVQWGRGPGGVWRRSCSVPGCGGSSSTAALG